MYKNTQYSYGSIARWLHWCVAILFLCAYCAVYYRHWFTEKQTPENMTALHLHLSFGITIGVIVLLRVIWKWMNVQPEPPTGTRIEHALAKIGHWLLYFFMITMPLTGYLGTKLDTDYFFIFSITKFPDTWLFDVLVWDWLGLTFEEWEEYVDFFHKRSGKYIVWVLILFHISAALYHQFYKKDNVLRRMWRGE